MKRGAIQPMALLAIGVVLVGGLFAYWQYNVMQGAEARFQTLQAEVPTEKEVEDELRKTESEVEEYQVRLNHLEKSVPPEAYVPTMLSELEALGKLNRISVTGVRPVPVPAKNKKDAAAESKKKKAYTEVEIDITGVGRYDDVLAMVNSLKEFPKVVAVRTISLTPKKDEVSKSQGLLETTIRLKAYVFSLDQGAKKGEDSASKPLVMNSTPGGTQ